MVQVKCFYAQNDLRNFSYLILDDGSGDSWVIDPYEAGPLIDYIKKEGLQLRGILNTHQHFDHIRGNAPLQAAFASPIRKLKGGETLELGEKFELETIDSPGHTMDHQVFVWKEEKTPRALFSGDTLFNAGVGNCRNGGSVESLYTTVQMLVKGLPPETILYPGHDYLERNLLFALSLEGQNTEAHERLRQVRDEEVSHRTPLTLGEELKINPFLRLDSEEIRSQLLPGGVGESKEGMIRQDLFRKIRALRDQW